MTFMRTPHAARGFTLIEVLVALLILSIGLLGVAAVQMLAVKMTGNASLRTLATMDAYDVVERIRANGQNFTAYATVTTAGCSSCPSGSVAANDVLAWQRQLARDLPSGQGAMTYANGVATITVTWLEREFSDGVIDANETEDGLRQQTYQLVVRLSNV